MYHRGSATKKELNRLSRVSQNDIIPANTLKSQQELQHIVSPFTTNRSGFEHSLENGWTYRTPNDKSPKTKGEYRMLINRNGVPYTAPSGPARGKIVLFDAWQSNEELLDIYENAFEKEWVPGTKVHGIPSYVDPHHSFDEEGGHITHIDYNADMEVMRVFWANRDYVTCYLGVPSSVYDMLHNCKGKTVPGRGRHNHLLGITFWDYIRIRGTMHGGRYPFFYNNGGPSGEPLHDISKDPRRKDWIQNKKRAKETVLDELQDNLKSAEAKADAWIKEKYGADAQKNLGDVSSKLETIFDSEEFKNAFDNVSFKSDYLNEHVVDVDDLVADYEDMFTNGRLPSNGVISKTLFSSDERVRAIHEILKEFKNIEDDALTAEDIRKSESYSKKLNKEIKKERKQLEDEWLNNISPLARRLYKFNLSQEYDALSNADAEKFAGTKDPQKEYVDYWRNRNNYIPQDEREITKMENSIYQTVARYDKKYPQGSTQVWNGIANATNWTDNAGYVQQRKPYEEE